MARSATITATSVAPGAVVALGLALLLAALAFPYFVSSLVALTAPVVEESSWRGSWQTSPPPVVLRETLRQRPMDSVAWAALAMATLQQPGGRDAAIRYYARSLDTARYTPGFMNWRLVLGASLWPDLPEDVRRQTAEQAWLLWQNERRYYLRLIRTAPLAGPLREMMESYYPAEMPLLLQRWHPGKHLENPR